MIADYNWHVWQSTSRSWSSLSTQQCPHVFSPQQACAPVPPPAARRTRRQRECTSGPGDRWRPMRQAAARERCTSAQLRRSNSRRRSPVRGRGPVRGRAGVPAPPGEPGVGERREAAGAGPGSSWGRGAQLQPARRGRRACGGGHGCAGVHGAKTVRRRGARVRRPLVGAGPPGSSWCPS